MKSITYPLHFCGWFGLSPRKEILIFKQTEALLALLGCLVFFFWCDQAGSYGRTGGEGKMFFAAAAIRLWNGGGRKKGETGSSEGIGLRRRRRRGSWLGVKVGKERKNLP